MNGWRQENDRPKRKCEERTIFSSVCWCCSTSTQLLKPLCRMKCRNKREMFKYDENLNKICFRNVCVINATVAIDKFQRRLLVFFFSEDVSKAPSLFHKFYCFSSGFFFIRKYHLTLLKHRLDFDRVFEMAVPFSLGYHQRTLVSCWISMTMSFVVCSDNCNITFIILHSRS